MQFSVKTISYFQLYFASLLRLAEKLWHFLFLICSQEPRVSGKTVLVNMSVRIFVSLFEWKNKGEKCNKCILMQIKIVTNVQFGGKKVQSKGNAISFVI